jgi:hypothetical protein
MDLADRSVEPDVEVVDGERVVDVQKTAAGAGRSKAQDFPIDPGNLSSDVGAAGRQEVGARPRAGQRLRQVDHVPDQAQLLQLRQRRLATALAPEEEAGQLVAGEGAMTGQRGEHRDLTLGQAVLERKKWRALACPSRIWRPLQLTVTSHRDTPSDTSRNAFQAFAPPIDARSHSIS